jgi:peptidoglycan hydrolase CwlO-like protein
MKTFSALIAAFFITAIIGIAMFGIGSNAILNPNTVPVKNSQTSAVNSTGIGTQAPTQAQIQQLQERINQYQSRDQQYQAQLNQLIQQVNQDNNQIQAYQSLLQELQRRGVIFIRRDGTILIPQG